MKRIQLASLGRRIISSLIDLSLFIGLTCLFYFTCFRYVVSNVQNFTYINSKIDEERIKSNLYINKDNKVISLIENNKDAGENELKDHIYEFYVNYYPIKDITETKDKEYWYNTHVLYLEDYQKKFTDITTPEITLLTWNDAKDGYVHKSTSTQDDVDEFFRITYSTAMARLNNIDPIKGYIYTISFANIRAVLYSSMIGSAIPYLLVPIILRNGKSIGKLITGLIVLTDEGYYYKRYKHIFRYLAFYFIEAFGGVVTIGLTFILSSSLVLFSKKKRALHDYIAFSVVVDEKHSLFFNDKEEEEMYKQKSLVKSA